MDFKHLQPLENQLANKYDNGDCVHTELLRGIMRGITQPHAHLAAHCIPVSFGLEQRSLNVTAHMSIPLRLAKHLLSLLNIKETPCVLQA